MFMKNKIIFLGLIFSTLAFGAYLGDPVNVKSGGTQLSTAPSSGQILVGTAGSLYALQSMSGGATMSAGGVVTLGNTAVTGQPITGYSSGAGVVSATDSILQAIQKLNGNIAAIVPGTGTVTSVAQTVPSFLSIAGSPVTTSGTLAISYSGTALPIANGGTNSTSALSNNRVMKSSGGAIIEAAAITANRALASDANGIPVATATTDTELGYVSGVTSAIQTQLGTKAALAGATFTGLVTLKEIKETTVAAGTCSTSYNVDPTLGSIINLTLSGACTIGVTNLAAGHSFTLNLTQSSTTAPVLSSAYKFPGGSLPTFSTSATKFDTLACESPDGTKLICGSLIDVR